MDIIEQIPAGTDWFREIKWDGYRVCVVRRGNAVSLRTKSNREPSARYKHIEQSLKSRRCRTALWMRNWLLSTSSSVRLSSY